MYKVIDNKGEQMFCDKSLKRCAGWAKATKKPNKDYIYVANENGDKLLKF